MTLLVLHVTPIICAKDEFRYLGTPARAVLTFGNVRRREGMGKGNTIRVANMSPESRRYVLSPKMHFHSRTVEMWLPEGENGRTCVMQR